jgi:uncharacterized membrane protein HdeD (DUF308 family)
MQVFNRASIAKNWWILTLRGIVAILFGIMALLWPGLTAIVLVLLFGAYALVDGIVAVMHAFQMRSMTSNWWVLLVEGIAGVLFGILALLWPGITALTLLYIVAAWAIITGIIEIASAFSLRGVGSLEWALGIAGVLSILFGIVLFLDARVGILTLIWLVALYAIIFGVVLVVRSLQLRSWARL